jgi:uncharacterized protein (TIGR03905 family)
MNGYTSDSDDARQPEYLFRTHGTCSRVIKFDIDDQENVRGVDFLGGCDGNTNGIAALVEGMPVSKVIEKCAGIRCGGKSTSCPDQLARALEEALMQREAQR